MEGGTSSGVEDVGRLEAKRKEKADSDGGGRTGGGLRSCGGPGGGGGTVSGEGEPEIGVVRSLEKQSLLN